MLQLLEVSQGLGCDAVGEVGRQHVSAGKLLGQWQCGYEGPGAAERPCGGQSCVARAVFPTRTHSLKLPKPSGHHSGWGSGLGLALILLDFGYS